MSAEEQYFNLCNQHLGRAVEIHTHEGELHQGIIERVDKTHVYVRTFDPNAGGVAGPGGPGLYAYGFGPGFAGGFLGGLTGVALGSIAHFRPYPYY